MLGRLMPGWLAQDPAWVSEILHWQWVLFAARLALTSAYLLGGLTKLFNFSAAIAEQEHFGFHPGWLWAAFALLAHPLILGARQGGDAISSK
jgi:hypothetical protein